MWASAQLWPICMPHDCACSLKVPQSYGVLAASYKLLLFVVGMSTHAIATAIDEQPTVSTMRWRNIWHIFLFHLKRTQDSLPPTAPLIAAMKLDAFYPLTLWRTACAVRHQGINFYMWSISKIIKRRSAIKSDAHLYETQRHLFALWYLHAKLS